MEGLLQPMNLLSPAIILAIIVIPIRLRTILDDLRKQTQSLEEIATRLSVTQMK